VDHRAMHVFFFLGEVLFQILWTEGGHFEGFITVVLLDVNGWWFGSLLKTGWQFDGSKLTLASFWVWWDVTNQNTITPFPTNVWIKIDDNTTVHNILLQLNFFRW
jgi:hypothetical protein